MEKKKNNPLDQIKVVEGTGIDGYQYMKDQIEPTTYPPGIFG